MIMITLFSGCANTRRSLKNGLVKYEIYQPSNNPPAADALPALDSPHAPDSKPAEPAGSAQESPTIHKEYSLTTSKLPIIQKIIESMGQAQ